MTFALYWFLGSLLVLAILAVFVYFDRKQATPSYDEACSKVDQELNEQGK